MSNNSVSCPDSTKLPKLFWDTYEQGEPYGLINLDLSRKIGRIGETQYPDPDVEGYNPCAEQSLADKETCCLAEIFLPNITSYNEFLKVMTYLYRINKHSLALPCHLPETEAIVHANMRMGIGVTGVYQASEEQRSWLASAYRYLRTYDDEYSQAHGFPSSIKLTTIKPSGTLSLLAGVTPGGHPSPAGPHYIRRVRIANGSPLVDVCKSHGYNVEPQQLFDGSLDKSTMVAEFPCKVPDTTPIGGDISAIEQLELVKWLQTNWSDNSVSVTIYYTKEELKEIKEWLTINYIDNVKTVSFLLYSGHGFIQAPYETITKEKYDELKEGTTPIISIDNSVNDMDESEGCESGACPVK
jgi:ribonucleoside-triphosphate reductase